jgi:multicomponent Na+:H+ antiporter subunit E
MRLIALALALFVFWLALSGHYTTFLVVSGALVSLAVAIWGRYVGYTDREGFPGELILRGLLYWPWLLKEIFKSGFSVARIILSPSLPVAPRLVRVKTSQRTAVGTATYANSITLTPGTITIEVDRHDRTLLVHALTAATAADLETGVMDGRVTRFEWAAG